MACPAWCNLFGIESPGLTASLAIADEVLQRSCAATDEIARSFYFLLRTRRIGRAFNPSPDGERRPMTPQRSSPSTARARPWSTTWSSSAPARPAWPPRSGSSSSTAGELSVVVLEKGSEPGAHILSGAVMDPRAIDELLPDWKERGAPLNQPVTGDEVLFLDARPAPRARPTGWCPTACTTTATTSSAWARWCKWLAAAGRGAGRGDLPRLRRRRGAVRRTRRGARRGHRQPGHRQGRRAARRLPARHGAAAASTPSSPKARAATWASS